MIASNRLWLIFALITTVCWGVWGALIELPEKSGFPATLGYAVWAFTMVPCAGVALALAGWRLDRGGTAIVVGMASGLLGAGGQVLLFQALRTGPAYLVFPIVSMYPVITVLLSATLLGERGRARTWAGVGLALVAVALLSYQPPADGAAAGKWWALLAAAVFLMWGLQAYAMKFATARMTPESLFFYLMLGALALVPAAVWMTDFARPITWGWRGPWAAALIQVFNSIGALTLVYALRYGQAIVVVPLTALAPMLTVVLSLLLYRVVPHPVVAAGLVVAGVAMYLLAE